MLTKQDIEHYSEVSVHPSVGSNDDISEESFEKLLDAALGNLLDNLKVFEEDGHVMLYYETKS